jgi:hypothetical protein
VTTLHRAAIWSGLVFTLLVACGGVSDRRVRPACSGGDTMTTSPLREAQSARNEQPAARPLPIVYWMGEKSAEPGPWYSVVPDSVYLLAVDYRNINATIELSDGQRVEWWRIDWRPAGQSAWQYLDASPIPPGADRYHLPASGIVNVKIFGLEPGDQLMFWRSQPWDGAPGGYTWIGGRP